jgi:hypothetical protein
MAFKAAPLNSAFLVASLVGLAASVFYLPQFSVSFSFAAGIVFLCMLIASFISMTRATPDAQLSPRLK